jgi:ribosomal protein S18 acetylase RimI-like enzyme
VEPGDAAGISLVHDEAWTEAYRGIIPGKDLERMVARRGPVWWHGAISRGSRIAVIDVGDRLAGYASYGRNRAPSLPFQGEVFELYVKPEFQGLGFGRRLFQGARRQLANLGLATTVVWTLAENERAIGFYEEIGGLLVGRAPEVFGRVTCERLAFGWR